jgi:hypothetical protein
MAEAGNKLTVIYKTLIKLAPCWGLSCMGIAGQRSFGIANENSKSRAWMRGFRFVHHDEKQRLSAFMGIIIILSIYLNDTGAFKSRHIKT